MNSVARELCLKNPNLISDRQLLIEQARKRGMMMVISTKRGNHVPKCWSLVMRVHLSEKKISQDYRVKRIAELQERMKDIGDQIGFKEKHWEAASNIRNYKECDNLTEQIPE